MKTQLGNSYIPVDHVCIFIYMYIQYIKNPYALNKNMLFIFMLFFLMAYLFCYKQLINDEKNVLICLIYYDSKVIYSMA